MASYNKVLLIGNLTRDPEMRCTASNKPVTSIGLASNESYKTASGEIKENTCFVDVTFWGKTAETAHQYLKKGQSIFIEGSLKFDQWTDTTTGQNRSKHTIKGESFRFLGAKNDQQSPQG
ncbi:MAG: single-stranded DNA-binding protein [Lentisphaeraceae bacterium]|nr:single-stranded DNA-binding protein [Lentisphaeraceae bacterium]